MSRSLIAWIVTDVQMLRGVWRRLGPTIRGAAAFATVLALAACGHPHHTTSKTPAPEEWKKLMNDAYYDGRIDHTYRCAVARTAVAHLPEEGCIYCSVPELILAYERKVC